MNFLFFYLKITRGIEERGNEKRLIFEKVSFSDGFSSLEEKTKKIAGIDYNNKFSVIYVLDTLDFIYKHYRNMRTLDSLADKYGKTTFNYLFITDCDDAIMKEFLKRKNINYENFNIVGNMDDFISSVYYQNKPVNKKIHFFGDTSNLDKSKFEKFKRLKLKPAYFVMDTAKKIIDFQNKNINILDDTLLFSIFNNNVGRNTISN